MSQVTYRRVTFWGILLATSLISLGVLAVVQSPHNGNGRSLKTPPPTLLKPTAKAGDAAISDTLKLNSGSALNTPYGKATAAALPQAGEQIKWQVIGCGGGQGVSTNYILNGTVGQTAVGPGTSTNYKLNQGFWQNVSNSCCVGKRGNVNMSGIVDLADLSVLVNFLTGGGYVFPCYDAANVNGLGIVDLADLSVLVSYLTGGGYVLPSCP
jgi:hypothetical protein